MTLTERRNYEAARRELACLTCEDEGEWVTPSGTAMPCPDCDLGNWNDTLETWDEMRMGK